MKYDIFISYADSDKEIVMKLKNQFYQHGVTSWVYSLDRTLAADVWEEIEEKISESTLIIFVVSKNTSHATGQKRELKLALDKIGSQSGTERIMPLFITGTDISVCPSSLRDKNGEFIDANRIKSVAMKIVEQVFPVLLKNEMEKCWKCPIPGEWLEISHLDDIIEKYFDIGDKLYFRSISPIGSFECYAPKFKALFWIAPENVRTCNCIEENKKGENEIPKKYTVKGTTEIQKLSWEALKLRKIEQRTRLIPFF
jgi:hypothetical protein